MQITFHGTPMTTTGNALKAGERMPDFTAMDTQLNPVRGDALTGIRVFLAVPSIDTGVCDREVRRFNAEARQLHNVRIYTVSMDLPFAQGRWCGAAGVQNVTMLSDYKDHSFGRATGTRIEELGLLARAVFVVGADGKLAYVEYVPEVTAHPDYEAAFNRLKALVDRSKA